MAIPDQDISEKLINDLENDLVDVQKMLLKHQVDLEMIYSTQSPQRPTNTCFKMPLIGKRQSPVSLIDNDKKDIK
ncbi:hypothetical protein QTN25_004009 [Entamoeba marina]